LGAALVHSQDARAQDAATPQNQSVADAARQTREAKKNAAKTSKVISDDDIDTKKVKPGAEGLNVGSQPKSDSQPPSGRLIGGFPREHPDESFPSSRTPICVRSAAGASEATCAWRILNAEEISDSPCTRFCRLREVVYCVGWLRLLVAAARRFSSVFGR